MDFKLDNAQVTYLGFHRFCMLVERDGSGLPACRPCASPFTLPPDPGVAAVKELGAR